VLRRSPELEEYTAKAFRRACERLGICQSMGRPGSALDNAVIESWHSTLEFELRRLEHFTAKAQARARVAAWIEDYNRQRRHSSLRMMSPVDYEQALQAGRRPEMSPLPHRPVSAGARHCPGRSSLDNACAPAVTWQLSDKRDSMISQIEVSTLSGEPCHSPPA
jgi:Integrase core domain